jgi:hypothetical protein
VTDGSGGVLAVWGSYRAGVRDVYAQWVSGSGVVQWAANGVVVCSAAGNEYSPCACSDGTDGAIVAWSDTRMGSTDYNIYAQHVDPTNSSILPGYRVWSLFDGETDEAAFDGSQGIAIPVMFETPEYDAGEKDVMKSFDRLQLYVRRGKADFTATVQTDRARATVSLSVDQTNATWGGNGHKATTLVWNQGRWSGKKSSEPTVGIPPGTIGKWCKLTVRASASEKLVLSGHALDFQLLPERPYV